MKSGYLELCVDKRLELSKFVTYSMVQGGDIILQIPIKYEIFSPLGGFYMASTRLETSTGKAAWLNTACLIGKYNIFHDIKTFEYSDIYSVAGVSIKNNVV